MLNARIKEQRLAKGLNQVQLSEKLGITKDLYNKYERTDIRPPYETIVNMAKIFGCTTDYLLGNEEIKKEPTDESVDPSFEKLKTRLIDSGLADELENLDDEKFESFLNIMQSLIKNIK